MSETVNVSNKSKDKLKKMSFGDHLEVLRKYLFRSIIGVLVFAVIAFFFKDVIFDIIIFGPRNSDFITNRLLCELANNININSLCINQNTFNIINIDLAGQFKAHILISFIIGLMLGFPYVTSQLWAFVKPALRTTEIKKSRGIIFVVSLLFTIGVLFGYFIIVPLTINFLSNYSVSAEITNQISFSSYISTITTISLSTGLVFELPVLVYFLSKIGLLTPKSMKKRRKHAIVIAFILSGIITPPDVFSQFLVALPLIGLYELSIGISRRVAKKRVVIL
jgi:sec-independent protein translocase protein TatC